MIDLHCHLLYGMDDGAFSREESVRMLEQAAALGIKVIIATPHFNEGIFEAEKAEEIFLEIRQKAAEYNILIKQGYEVFVNPSSAWNVRSRKRLTLDQSRYILLEFPFNTRAEECCGITERLTGEYLIPIIAHPERNRYFLTGFDRFLRLIRQRCMIQVDAASIAGVYGMKVKAFVRRLIELNLVDFVASNAHCAKDYMQWYEIAYGRVLQWSGREQTERLFHSNAEKILFGQPIESHKRIKLRA